MQLSLTLPCFLMSGLVEEEEEDTLWTNLDPNHGLFGDPSFTGSRRIAISRIAAAQLSLTLRRCRRRRQRRWRQFCFHRSAILVQRDFGGNHVVKNI